MKITAILFLAVAVALAGSAREDVGDWTGIGSGPGGGIGDWDYPMDVLHDNGPFVTGEGLGSGGADVSEMNAGESTYGFGFQVANGNMIADVFEVPAGATWDIETITIFGYQTNSGTTPTINDIRLAVYDDVPTTGALIWGDMSSNVFTSSSWTDCYRVNTGDYTSTARPIMANVCEVSGLSLTEGSYWLVFQAGGTGSSGPWANPVTIAGVPSEGVAMQYTSSGWAQALMGGTGNGVTFPFILEGPTALNRTTWGEIKSLF